MTPIIALDFKDKTTTLDFLSQFPKEEHLFVKVGMELFYAEGPAIITEIQQARPVSIFLDLKLHDIPNTVEKAAWQLGKLGVAMTTVHAAGGKDMMIAAKRRLLAGGKAGGHHPGVTSQTRAIGWRKGSWSSSTKNACDHAANFYRSDDADKSAFD